MSQPSSGFSWTGLAVIVVFFAALFWFLGSIGRAESEVLPVSPSSVTRHIEVAAPCDTCHHVSCRCKSSKRRKPTFNGEVDGFKTGGNVPRSSHYIEMGGSRVSATGLESSMNAQLLHSQAIASRERSFAVANETTRQLAAPPKEVVRTVTKTVYLTVPAPTFVYYPVGPTTVCDAYGYRWHYAGYGWRRY